MGGGSYLPVVHILRFYSSILKEPPKIGMTSCEPPVAPFQVGHTNMVHNVDTNFSLSRGQQYTLRA